MKILSTLLAVFLLFAATCAVAQDDTGEYQDTYHDILEVSIYGGLNMPVGGIKDWETETATGPVVLKPKTGFLVGGELGYFATENLVVGFQFHYSQYAIDTKLTDIDSRKHRFYSPAVYLKYYFFSESNFAPYIRAHAGVDFPKFATSVVNVAEGDVYLIRELSYDPAFAFGAGAGVFYYTNDYGGLFLEVNYHQNLADGSIGKYGKVDYKFGKNAGYLDIHAGISVYFGSE